MTLLQIIPLFVFNVNASLFVLIILILLINLLLYFFENKKYNLNSIRFLSLVVFIIIGGFFNSSITRLNYNSDFVNWIQSLDQFNYLFLGIENINWIHFNLVLFGVLILLNEINFLIRYFFEKLSLFPNSLYDESGRKKIDTQEYNAGRVIGMLERFLIFLFVLFGQYTAIGFIIAAKGFTRFKELDKREFAEYVLIGTLLSGAFAFIVALIIKSLLV